MCPNHKNLRKKTWKKILALIGVFGLFNFLWLLLRSGFRPSRLRYPCQQAALGNFLFSLKMIAPSLAITTSWKGIQSISKKAGTVFLIGMFIGSSISFVGNYFPREVNLNLQYTSQAIAENSDIFIMNGRLAAHIDSLIELMGENGLKFYQTTTTGPNQGPNGLINASDIILIKNNCQWSQRGGSNTDILKELIQVIVDHPDGFTGEVVIADNGQGRGNMDWSSTNAKDKEQSANDVALYFAESFNVSTFLWDTIRYSAVNEYVDGDSSNGYVKNNTADPDSHIFVTYPKFQTIYGTNISLKYGIWNGTGYTHELKIINLPVLKSHSGFGVTACIKNYMGVQSQGVGNGHACIGDGGMGSLMAEFGMPTLNILDAIWVNANPAPGLNDGPYTSYLQATRINILMASTDPVALDYWAGKYVLKQTSVLIGNGDEVETMDPDTSARNGLEEAFGVYLNNSRDELLSAGYNVTSDELEMNIYGETSIVVDTGPKLFLWIGIGGGAAVLVAGGLTAFLIIRKKRRKSKLI